MTAYYNEIEPYAADWLRQLIKEGHIADGEVDTRSIVDVRPRDLVAFEQCHFFAGLGGWPKALRLAGFPDKRPVWTGSCPCQPFSVAGKQRGFDDARHLWPAWRDLVAERRPAKVYGEQVASAAEWLRLVRGDLEALDYAVGAIPIEAASAGADHLRDRYWFVADADSEGLQERVRDGRVQSEALGPRTGQASGGHGHVADADQPGASAERQQRSREQCGPGCDPGPCIGDVGDAIRAGTGWNGGDGRSAEAASSGKGHPDGRRGDASEPSGAALDWVIGADGKARRVKPGIRLLAHGVPNRVAKLRALGNAIDLRPAVAFIRATM